MSDVIDHPATPELRDVVSGIFVRRMLPAVMCRAWLDLTDTDAIASAAIHAGFGDRLARTLAPRVQVIASATRRGSPAMA